MVLDSDDRSLAGRSRSRTYPSYELARTRGLLCPLVRRPPPVQRSSLENPCVSSKVCSCVRLEMQLQDKLNLPLRNDCRCNHAPLSLSKLTKNFCCPKSRYSFCLLTAISETCSSPGK